MKLVHPISNVAFTIAALALLSGAVGCKNQQSAVAANPFFGPTRVPPPSTRALLPGQAQPYYQGDPLPVTQNGTPQPNPVALASAETETPTAGGNLAWASPSGAAQMPRATPAPMSSRAASPSAVASNEPTVAIPGDGDSLRFALSDRAAAPAEPQQFSPRNPLSLASTPVASPLAATNTQQPPQLPGPPSARDVMQATYTEPVITSSQVPAPSPWQSPQIAPTSPPLALNAPPSLPPNYAVPTITATNTMEVRLREVPSPPMPRIRIPGSNASVLSAGSADGFRPRTSMR